MLIKLLNIFNQGETHSLEDIVDMLKTDVAIVKAQLEYLENQGYIKRVIVNVGCSHREDCSKNRWNLVMWEISKLP